MSLTALLGDLASPTADHAYTVVRVPRRLDAYFGFSRSRGPSLFMAAPPAPAEPPLRAAGVTYCRSQPYDLALPDGSRASGSFQALICESHNPSDVQTFVSLVEAYLAQPAELGSGPQALITFFRAMARLFAQPPTGDLATTRQGLWAELFMMREFRGFRFWAPYWHSDVSRTFDFSAPGRRVEVKSTASPIRAHVFSHRQVFHLVNEQIVIASLILHPDDAGLGLQQLIAECRADLLGTSHYIKLEAAVRHAGMADSAETGPRFEPAAAGDQLAWYHVRDVPHFADPEPPGVSDTHYRVDLSTIPQIALADLGEWLNTW